MKTFKEYVNENSGFNIKDLIEILKEEGYHQYKRDNFTRRHEYTNKHIIISIGTNNNGKSMNTFTVEDEGKNNATPFEFETLEGFRKIIRNRNKNAALRTSLF